MGTVYEKRPHTVVATVWHSDDPVISDLHGNHLSPNDGDYIVRDMVTGAVSVMAPGDFEQQYEESGSVDWEAFEGAPDPNGPDAPATSSTLSAPESPQPAFAGGGGSAGSASSITNTGSASNPANPTA